MFVHQNGNLAFLFNGKCRIFCFLRPTFGSVVGVLYRFDDSILRKSVILLHYIALFAIRLHPLTHNREVSPCLRSSQMSHLSILMSCTDCLHTESFAFGHP